MSKQCGACKHYDPIKGEPPAGYCHFMDGLMPFWMDKFKTHIESLGSDVLATDGEDCDAFTSSD